MGLRNSRHLKLLEMPTIHTSVAFFGLSPALQLNEALCLVGGIDFVRPKTCKQSSTMINSCYSRCLVNLYHFFPRALRVNSGLTAVQVLVMVVIGGRVAAATVGILCTPTFILPCNNNNKWFNKIMFPRSITKRDERVQVLGKSKF